MLGRPASLLPEQSARLTESPPLGAAPRGWALLRPLRAARRLLSVILWTLAASVVQATLLALPGSGKVRFARLYWRVTRRLIGVRLRVIGEVAGPRDGRSVVYACNHSSWLDIPALGGVLPGCFVSKDDIAAWPVIGTVARLGRTVFVSRRASSTGRERDDMLTRLAAGDNLVLFPEGTSSDGARVLPFRTSFFAIAEGERPPIIQPVSIVYDRLAGLPAGRASRAVFSWYGDMDLAPHAWRLMQWRGMSGTVLLHAPLDPRDFGSRKAVAQAAWQAVADGASALRQNRPAHPAPAHPVDAATPAPAESAVFA
jgi:1-acyl-sn-glycerol-3-phosphate acyltransferase